MLCVAGSPAPSPSAESAPRADIDEAESPLAVRHRYPLRRRILHKCDARALHGITVAIQHGSANHPQRLTGLLPTYHLRLRRIR